ncbi:signal peptidase I [Actinomyces respiraculi]|uniref:signal peptidase I n=1 Tax=Actinomyces respiraculi TaxID=2744574 RepID=UPI00141F1F22|nr:signal peptidase I [Actinomyces respiraculi]
MTSTSDRSAERPADTGGAPAEESPQVLRTADTPDAAPEHLPTTTLPPSYPPVRRAASPEPRARTSQAPVERRRRGRSVLSALVAVVAVLVVTALIKTFVIQWFEIPSASMEDTLAVGDRVAVWMWGADDLERGDVVVFRDPDHWLTVTEPTGLRAAVQDLLILMHQLPEDTGHILIKRVIGLPGDHVVADGSGTLSVNGVVLDESYVKVGRSASDVAFDVVVPEGFIWVMGDNRSNSADSRYHQDDAHGGFVPMTDVIGEGAAVVWPVSSWAGLGDGTHAFDLVPEPGRAPDPARPEPEEGA